MSARTMEEQRLPSGASGMSEMAGATGGCQQAELASLRRIGWLPLGLIALALAQAADVLTFILVATRVDISQEQNPVTRFLYAAGGSLAPSALKILVIGTLIVIARRLPPSRGLALLLFLGVATGLIGAVCNTWSYLEVAQMRDFVGQIVTVP